MKEAIEEYMLAFEENVRLSKLEVECKKDKIKAHYRLIKAKEALRDKEYDLLEANL